MIQLKKEINFIEKDIKALKNYMMKIYFKK